MAQKNPNVYANKNVENQVTDGIVIKGPDLNENLSLE